VKTFFCAMFQFAVIYIWSSRRIISSLISRCRISVPIECLLKTTFLRIFMIRRMYNHIGECIKKWERASATITSQTRIAIQKEPARNRWFRTCIWRMRNAFKASDCWQSLSLPGSLTLPHFLKLAAHVLPGGQTSDCKLFFSNYSTYLPTYLRYTQSFIQQLLF